MNNKSILIIGSTGQLGSWLLEYYLKETDLLVYGTKRKSSSVNNTHRIDHLYDNPRLKLFYADVTDYASIIEVVRKTEPDYLVNCAAVAHVHYSFSAPAATAMVDSIGVINVLEAVRNFSPSTHVVQMSTSELMGNAPAPQNEETLNNSCNVRSPYAAAKLLGFNSVRIYREAYKLFCSNIIAFNFESINRDHTYVTRKITSTACRIKEGLTDRLYLGNLDSRRNWNHVSDTSQAIKLILEHTEPDDFCIGGLENHSVKEFVEKVFDKLDLDWKQYVKTDSRLFRPLEVNDLACDPAKAKKVLGWKPKYNLDMIIDEMIANDWKLAKQEKLLKSLNDAE